MSKSIVEQMEISKWEYTRKNWAFYATFIGIYSAISVSLFGNNYIPIGNYYINVLICILILALVIYYFIYKTYLLYNIKIHRHKLNQEKQELDNHKNHKLKKNLKIAEKKLKEITSKKNNKYKRFEDIISSSKSFKTLSIEYKPFFYKERDNDRGIGMNILNMIFSPFENIEFEHFYRTGLRTNNLNWNTILEEFDNRDNTIDLILTPLYETRTRLFKYNVSFSIPLFYSSFGLYVREEQLNSALAKIELSNKKFEFSELEGLFKRKGFNELKFAYLDGELSEILCSKVKGEIIKESSNNTVCSEQDFTDMLKDVSNPDSSRHIVFMEVFKAEKIKEKEGLTNLINILDNHSLIYPVGFVFRKEETVLRNFVNLRIMDLKKNGKIEQIIRDCALEYGLKETEVSSAFMQSFDFSKICPNYIDFCYLFSEKQKKQYNLLEEVYGNYTSFQKEIKPIIQDFRKDEKINILEIGFGTGITTEIIQSARNSSNYILIAVDNDFYMKNILINNNRINKSLIKIISAEIINYLKNYEGEPFDLVVSGFTIHNFSSKDREQLYELLYANMSKNSLFVNADKYSQNNEEDRLKSLKYRIDKYVEYAMKYPEYNEVISEWVEHYVRDQSPTYTMIKDEAKKALRKANFKEINLEVPRSIEDIEMMAILTAKKHTA